MNSSSTDTREIRKFGLVGLIFFGGLGLLCLWRGKEFAAYFFVCLALLCCGFLALPRRFRKVYKIWLTVAHFVGKMITVATLTLAYYLVITPAAFLVKLFRGRLLPMARDRNVSTYWVDREEPAQPKERFQKRY